MKTLIKVAVSVSRIIVGALFIFSGLIKLNDPLGFSYKLNDYFAADVLNLEFLIPFALPLAIFLVIFEVVLGIMLLIGYKVRFTVWSLLLMIVFFTFLTFYSAYFNKVTDCGCFGDAIPLTPWQSFYKDVILTFFIVILFFGWKHIKPIFTNKINTATTGICIVLCGLFGYHVLNNLPTIDFRAYKVGENIEDGMNVAPEDMPVFSYEYIYKINGAEKIFEEYIGKNETDTIFVDMRSKMVKEGKEAPIHDFSMDKDGTDHTPELLAEEKLIVMVAYDLSKSDDEGMNAIRQASEKAVAAGYKVIGLTATFPNEIIDFKDSYALDFDFYTCDETALKTIVRSNPGIIKLQKGTIVQKLHFNNADDLDL